MFSTDCVSCSPPTNTCTARAWTFIRTASSRSIATRSLERSFRIDGPPVARLTVANGEWAAERVPASRKSDQLQQFEQERTQTTATEYQKPVRGRLAIWKKRLSGG